MNKQSQLEGDLLGPVTKARGAECSWPQGYLATGEGQEDRTH